MAEAERTFKIGIGQGGTPAFKKITAIGPMGKDRVKLLHFGNLEQENLDRISENVKNCRNNIDVIRRDLWPSNYAENKDLQNIIKDKFKLGTDNTNEDIKLISLNFERIYAKLSITTVDLTGKLDVEMAAHPTEGVNHIVNFIAINAADLINQSDPLSKKTLKDPARIQHVQNPIHNAQNYVAAAEQYARALAGAGIDGASSLSSQQLEATTHGSTEAPASVTAEHGHTANSEEAATAINEIADMYYSLDMVEKTEFNQEVRSLYEKIVPNSIGQANEGDVLSTDSDNIAIQKQLNGLYELAQECVGMQDQGRSIGSKHFEVAVRALLEPRARENPARGK